MMSRVDDDFDMPPDDGPYDENAELPFATLGDDGPTEDLADEVRRRHETDLLAIDGVEGITTEPGAPGELQIVVLVRDMSVARELPGALDGVPVVAEVAEFEAFGEVSATEPGKKAPKKKAPKKRAAKKKAAAKKATKKKAAKKRSKKG